VHSTGVMQTRDEFFRLLENKTIRYLSFDVEKTSYRVYGDTVVGTGVQRIEVMSGGKSLVLHSRYTVMYTMRAGTEQLIAYQSTPMPELATKAK
jgi:ketosteroid isomerase-like protein